MRKPRTELRSHSDTARGAVLVALIVADVLYGVELRDPAGAGLFAIFLLLPRDNPFFDWIRQMHPTVASGLLGLCLLLPIPDHAYISGDWNMAFAHLAMLLAVWKFQHHVLRSGDYLFLMGISLFLALMSTGGERDAWFAPLLALYAVTAMVVLTLLNLERETDRVLGLARVRSFERGDAPEVAAREDGPRFAIFAALRHLSFLLIAGGLVLAWMTPRLIVGIGDAWEWVVFGEGSEEEDPLPEFADEEPRFEMPPGVVSADPFGDRLDRDEFLKRRDEDRLALMVKPGGMAGAPTRDLDVRGECFDYLTSDGRWIRSRTRTSPVVDAEDGLTDGRVNLLPQAPGVALDLTFLLPPGRDRTVYLSEVPVWIGAPRVHRDGTGNLMFPHALARARKYQTECSRHEAPDGAVLFDPGPEFFLIPHDIDRGRLDEIVSPFVEDFPDPARRAREIVAWVRTRFVNTETDERAVGADAEIQRAPARVDVPGFLFDRKWGRDIDFASAAAMLLRAAGIPSRLATGYREGQWISEESFFVFRSGDLVPWVEVPFEGLGWVPHDPIPFSVDELPPEMVDEIFELPPDQRAAEAEEAIVEAREDSLVQKIIDRIDTFVSGLLPGGSESTTFGRLLAWLIVVTGVALVAWTFLRAARRVGAEVIRRREEKAKGYRPVPFYERLVAVLAAHGLRRRPAETPLEFAMASAPRAGPDVVSLTKVFCALRYGQRLVDEERTRELFRRVEAVESRLEEVRPEETGVRPGLTAAILLLVMVLAGPLLAQAPDLGDAIDRLGSDDRELRRDAVDEIVAAGVDAAPDLLRLFDAEERKDLTERIATLIARLDDDDYRVRERAVAELVAIGRPALKALEAATRRGSPETRHRARVAIGRIRIPTAPELQAERQVVHRRRTAALRVLGRIGGAAEVEPLAMVGLMRGEFREAVVSALAAIAPRERNAVAALLSREPADLRLMALKALSRSLTPDLRPRILILTADRDERVRRSARRALVTPEVVEKTDAVRLLIKARNFPAAEEKAREVLGLCPGYAPAGSLLFRLLMRKARVGEALVVVRGLDIPATDRLVMEASALFRMNRHDEALSSLKRAYELRPGHIPALIHAARIHLAKGLDGVQPALVLVERAISSSLNDPEPWVLKGLILEPSSVDPAGAKEAYQRALQIDPDDEDARKGHERLGWEK